MRTRAVICIILACLMLTIFGCKDGNSVTTTTSIESPISTGILTSTETLTYNVTPNEKYGESPADAAPAGVTINTTIDKGSEFTTNDYYEVQVTLLEFARGKKALELVKWTGLVDTPEAGYEYAIARIRFTYVAQDVSDRGLVEAQSFKLAEGQFAAFSADGTKEYPSLDLTVQPEPQLHDWVFFPGESREGWVVLLVSTDEQYPLMVFKREYKTGGDFQGFSPVWFRLY